MDIENIWNQSGGSDEALNKLLMQNDFKSFQSKLPLNKLRKNLLSGMGWAVLITIFYIYILFFIHFWQVYLSLGILIFFNIWIILKTWKLYKNTPPSIIPSNSIKQELKRNYDSFNKWWSIQLKVSLFIYPIAAMGGFIIGGVLGSGKTADSFLYNYRVLSFMIITVIILMPLSFIAVKWLFNHTYGKHLKKIKLLIDELSN